MKNKTVGFIKRVWFKIVGKHIGVDYHNLYHPDFEGQTEAVFKVNGVQYYRFIKESSMKWGRYMYLQTFLHEQSLKVDLELLKGYISLGKRAINGSMKNGIDLNLVHKIFSQLESRCELAFEADTTYRLASVLYFDDQEDLYSYDKAHNDKKVESWKEARAVDFFYTMPMSELLGLSDLSPQDLVKYMEQGRAVLEELTIEMPEL